MKPFSNLTNFFFSISPSEYYKNLLNEEWGCFKYVGMSWDMIMKLPIQERRALVHKHNLDSEAVEREIQQGSESGGVQKIEGSQINRFAERTQNNPLGG